MYERKIPVDLDCPLRLTLSLIGSKWKSCILDELRHRPMRPSELHCTFPEATPRVLDLQLKELVDDGLASKTIFTELPPRPVYAITPLDMSLVPIIDAMLQWEKRTGDCLKGNMATTRQHQTSRAKTSDPMWHRVRPHDDSIRCHGHKVPPRRAHGTWQTIAMLPA